MSSESTEKISQISSKADDAADMEGVEQLSKPGDTTSISTPDSDYGCSKTQHIQLLREFPAGTCLQPDSSSKLSQPLQHTMQAWYDAPLQLQSGTLLSVTQDNAVTGINGCLEFSGAVSGNACRIKIDTGASHNFLSSTYASKAILAVTPCKRTVALADGMQVPIIGTCTARLKLGSICDIVSFYVLKLSHEYDVVLGAQWLKQRSAVLRFQEGTLTVRTRTGPTTIAADPIVSPDSGGGESVQSDISTIRLSALQMKRAARKGAELFLVMVKKVPETGEPVCSEPQPVAKGLIYVQN